ncbi:hypothetical protein, variant [Exophiala mesophila]|uniref:Transcription initiation factor TFIID subunit 4 n=1 Tax=Exophiala mesophila TaxID=212818 RepID=A0A0D1Y9Q1_EXOME|nr:hypothetical protein, variant [Exophiala mesophila]KIV97381.1 hypothetical protein, variant [Exophiala mesophila]
MAQPQPASSRPPLPPTQTSFHRDFPPSNSRPSPQSPQMPVPYSTPSPQQFSPTFNQPPAKRMRMSPEIQSPIPASSQPATPTAQPSTPIGGPNVNGSTPNMLRPGSMAPPQRPVDKPEKPGDRNYEDILSGTGINIEEEARMLSRPDYYANSAQNSFQSRPGFDSRANSFTAPGSQGEGTAMSLDQLDGQPPIPSYQPTAEELKSRGEQRLDWEAARHSQHPLWDMFLLGGALNEKIRNISISEHLVDPQSGVLVNTQKVGPPPVVRVNGLEAASRVIDRGQAILDTGQKGERLSEIMKIVSLATRARLTGLISSASRISRERQDHAKGKIPDEWQDIAVPIKAPTDLPEGMVSPAGSSSLKRTLSQANGEKSALARLVDVLDIASSADRAREDARRQKRLKRRNAGNAEGTSGPNGVDAAAEAALAAMEAEKKTTKKERKLAESKFSEQQQHKSANEAARMAVSGLMGNRFGGKKQRTYDWMNPGKGASAASSPAATPGRAAPGSGATSAATTPAGASDRARTSQIAKGKQLGQWDETKDAKIQARDVFLVLESDGRASRSYIRGLSLPET